MWEPVRGTFCPTICLPARMAGHPVGFIDDDVQLWNRWINGLPVFGGRESLSTILETTAYSGSYHCFENADKEFIRDIFRQMSVHEMQTWAL